MTQFQHATPKKQPEGVMYQRLESGQKRSQMRRCSTEEDEGWRQVGQLGDDNVQAQRKKGHKGVWKAQSLDGENGVSRI